MRQIPNHLLNKWITIDWSNHAIQRYNERFSTHFVKPYKILITENNTEVTINKKKEVSFKIDLPHNLTIMLSTDWEVRTCFERKYKKVSRQTV